MKNIIALTKKLYRDKSFFRSMLVIAAPVAIQKLFQSGLNMVDTLMIGRLGETEIGAVALSNQIYFLMILLLFGINSGSSVFASQYWGKKDIKGIRETLALGLFLSCGSAILFSIGAIFFPETILSFCSKDPEVIRIGGSYLKIVGFSYLCTSITLAFSSSLRSTEIVKITTIVSAVSLGINTILNYFLIFGIGFFPALGVRGAAIATVAARIIETLILLFFIYKHKYPSAIQFNELIRIKASYIKRFLKTSGPVILNEVIWSSGIFTINVIFAQISTEALAAYSITDTIMKLFVIFFFGTSGACAVMVGNRIGAGKNEQARYYANSYALIAPVLGLIIGIIIYPLAGVIPELFNISEEAKTGVTSILRVISFVLPMRIFNWHMIVGILRSGGDTLFSLLLEAGGIWLIAVPATAVTGLVFHLPLSVIYFALSIEELVKFSICLYRLKSGKWLKNVIDN